jgi:ribose transport system ATP-binding protein
VTAATALSVRNLSKHFGGVQALDAVSLSIRQGEVHGLLGENGSGKSTLIKILAGFHAPEPGAALTIRGEPVELPLPPGRFRDLGLSFVHQDLGLVPTLTALENLRIDDYAASWQWHISWRNERRRAAATLDEYGVAIDPDAVVEELSQVDRALLAIVRAVHSSLSTTNTTPILVLDEPTVFLPRNGVERLFDLIRTIVARGASVLFVSHDLGEVREITDRVTVLRDGRLQGTVETPTATESHLIEMIVGRKFAAAGHITPAARAEPFVEANIQTDGLADFSLTLHKGEVVGLTGLVGSGFERLPYVLYGSDPAAGTLTIGGDEVDVAQLTAAGALRLGIALLPANRQRDGSVGELSVAENVMLPVLDRYTRHGRLRHRELERDSQVLLERFDVRPNRPNLPYGALSGGNQQKALLAKWLQVEPRLLLLHEPTQGVDVGAREQIFAIIAEATARGTAVICASSDYEQLGRLCDRVLIFARGHIVSELHGDRIDKDQITEECLNSHQLLAHQQAAAA